MARLVDVLFARLPLCGNSAGSSVINAFASRANESPFRDQGVERYRFRYQEDLCASPLRQASRILFVAGDKVWLSRILLVAAR